MRLSEFLRSPYSSTELCSIIPASILEMDPELEWDQEKESEHLWKDYESSYPEEVEVTFQSNAGGCRFSFDQSASVEEDALAGAEQNLSARQERASGRSKKQGHSENDPSNLSMDGSLKSATDLLSLNLESGSVFPPLPLNAEIRMHEDGQFRGLICYELKQERATLITLEPTEWHSAKDRDFVQRAALALKSPGINWYLGYGWGALAQIRSDEEDSSLLIFKESENRYTMEFYYPGGLQELGESL
ncbi:MAG: hypothetical protein RH862_04855 [Leptospiraceae bacterium]